MNVKLFNGNNLRHEFLLTTKQKISSEFENNISTDIKLSKT